MMKAEPFAVAAAAGLLLATIGCGGKTVEQIPDGAQGDARLMALGTAALEDEDWLDARGYFRQLLDSYPRSQLAGDARLGVADTYFNQRGSGNLILAIAEYRDFLTFFPNHPRADYAQYQIAYGHYRQIHSPDRDQEPTRTAVEEFEKLIELYRNSNYAEQGRELLAECYERLAESELRIGRFYLEVRKHCRAPIPRLKAILENYPDFSKLDEVHFLLAESHRRCNQPMEAMPYYQKILDDFPESEFREDAETNLSLLRSAQSAQ